MLTKKLRYVIFKMTQKIALNTWKKEDFYEDQKHQ